MMLIDDNNMFNDILFAIVDIGNKIVYGQPRVFQPQLYAKVYTTTESFIGISTLEAMSGVNSRGYYMQASPHRQNVGKIFLRWIFGGSDRAGAGDFG